MLIDLESVLDESERVTVVDSPAEGGEVAAAPAATGAADRQEEPPAPAAEDEQAAQVTVLRPGGKGVTVTIRIEPD